MRFPPAPRRRLRARASILAVAVLLGCAGAAAAPAAAGAEVLFNTITGPITASGPNVETVDASFWVAQPFVPDLSGRADVVSFWSQCVGIGCASRRRDGDPRERRRRAGRVLGTAGARVGDTLGGAPTCARVAGTPALTAGVTYWAVMRGAGSLATWNFQTNAPKTVLVSSNAGGVWRAGAIQKTFGLKVEQSTGGCGPDILPNPPAGTAVADMIARPGGASFNTIFIANRGNASLTLRGASFSGPDAATFELLDAQPGPLARPLTFPRQIAANPQAGLIMYVVCRGAGASGAADRDADADVGRPRRGLDRVARPLPDRRDAAHARLPAGPDRAGRLVDHLAGVPHGARAGPRVEQLRQAHRVHGHARPDARGVRLDHEPAALHRRRGARPLLHRHRRGRQHQRGLPRRGADRHAAPVPAFDAVPAVTNDATPELSFHATDATSGVARFECRVDGAGAPAPCTSPATLPAQADGATAWSSARSTWPATCRASLQTGWTLDTVPPETALTAGPEGATTATGATFGYSGDALGGTPLARFECALDGAPFATCPAAGTTSRGLAAAAHEFAVRAVDAAGNADPTPARARVDGPGPRGRRGRRHAAAGGRSDHAGRRRARPRASGAVARAARQAQLPRRRLRAEHRRPAQPRRRAALHALRAGRVTLAVQRRAGRRWRAVRGRITVSGKAGVNRVRLSGRLRRRALPPARYRLRPRCRRRGRQPLRDRAGAVPHQALTRAGRGPQAARGRGSR